FDFRDGRIMLQGYRSERHLFAIGRPGGTQSSQEDHMTGRRLFSVITVGLSLAIVATVTAATRAAAPGGNWPQWRGPLRDGVSTETGLLSSWPAAGPPLVWSAKGLGRGFSSISV